MCFAPVEEAASGAYSKRLQWKWLTDVADVKMLVEIRSLMNNFIEDFLSLKKCKCDNFNLYSVGISL